MSDHDLPGDRSDHGSDDAAPDDRTTPTARPDGAGPAGDGAPGDGSGGEDRVRRENHPCAGPAELELALDLGRIQVELSDGADRVELEVRAEPRWGGDWTSGLGGWLTDTFGGSGRDAGGGTTIRIGGREINLGNLGGGVSIEGNRVSVGGREFDLGGLGDLGGLNLRDVGGHDLTGEALRAAEVRWHEDGRRLVVRSSTGLPARLVPLVVTVRAPAGSRLTLSTGAGPIEVTGRSGPAEARTGAGDITLGDVDGELTLRTGAGSATARSVSGRTRARTGSGRLRVDRVSGPAEFTAGSGELRLGSVRADLRARTGSGDLSVADAESGAFDLTTGSGDLRIGVHTGVAAQLDLRSGSGRVRSELDVNPGAPTTPQPGAPTLSVHGRAGSGDVLVTRALSTAGTTG